MSRPDFTPAELVRIGEIRKSLDSILDGGMTQRERDLHQGLFTDEYRALFARATEDGVQAYAFAVLTELIEANRTRLEKEN